jgi:hypothetical protein
MVGLQVLRIVSQKKSSSPSFGVGEKRNDCLKGGSRLKSTSNPLRKLIPLCLKSVQGYHEEQSADEWNCHNDRPFDRQREVKPDAEASCK